MTEQELIKEKAKEFRAKRKALQSEMDTFANRYCPFAIGEIVRFKNYQYYLHKEGRGTISKIEFSFKRPYYKITGVPEEYSYSILLRDVEKIKDV